MTTEADTQRLKRLPTKQCPTCFRTLPNTPEYFGLNLTGRIVRRCLECIALHPVPTAIKQTCPICRRLRRLYRDRGNYEPTPLHMCRPCLMLVNALVGATPLTLANAAAYLNTRNQPGNKKPGPAGINRAGPLLPTPRGEELSDEPS